MKVIEEQHVVEQSGDLIEVGAAIKATSKAFHVLSNHLYSDKILAIVRELSCNAYDSHVDAGKADVPIDIRLPTSLDPTFYVKDYGLGMSDFDVRGGYTTPDGTKVSHEEGRGKPGYKMFHGVYTTFFESTKTNSNEVIGQLGLGSKSPYAYAHTFTVESRFNSEKRLYTCYKNANNEPAISLMSTEATEESNGMTVSLAVATADLSRFSQAAKKALMYFRPRPNLFGQDHMVPYNVEHTVAGTDWKIRNADYYAYMRGAYVVQGFVPYPVDVEQLTLSNRMSPVAKQLAQTDIDLYVPIGDVEVAPSREALSYDRRTIDNVLAALERAAAEFRVSIQAQIDSATTMWEAGQAAFLLRDTGEQHLRNAFGAMHRSQAFKWKGQEIKETFKLDLSSIRFTAVYRGRHNNTTANRLKYDGSWNPQLQTKVFEFNATCNTVVIIDDKLTGNQTRIASYLKSLPKKGSYSPAAIIIRPITNKSYSKDESLKIVKMLGDAPVLFVDDLPALPKPVRTGGTPRSKRKVNEVLRWVGFPMKKSRSYWSREQVHRKFSAKTWTVDEIDLNVGRFYVEVDKFVVLNNHGHEYYQWDVFLEDARKLGYLNNTHIYGFTKKDVVNLDKSVWVNAFDFVLESFKKDVIDSGEYNRAYKIKAIRNQLTAQILHNIVLDHDELLSKLVDGPLKKAALAIHTELTKPDPIVDKEAAERMRGRLMSPDLPSVIPDVNHQATVLAHQLNDAIAQYPFMKLIEIAKIGSCKDVFIDLVNQVDNQRLNNETVTHVSSILGQQ